MTFSSLAIFILAALILGLLLYALIYRHKLLFGPSDSDITKMVELSGIKPGQRVAVFCPNETLVSVLDKMGVRVDYYFWDLLFGAIWPKSLAHRIPFSPYKYSEMVKWLPKSVPEMSELDKYDSFFINNNWLKYIFGGRPYLSDKEISNLTNYIKNLRDKTVISNPRPLNNLNLQNSESDIYLYKT